ncbi:MAG: YihY/virulence factor BrkB family protein [Opitutales bacterium]|nr:YihY/virulence factor BrkB family protein [Opitutales bacterium]
MAEKKSIFLRLKRRLICDFSRIREKVWSFEASDSHPVFRSLSWLWRVIELSVVGTIKNAITLQAAALTYWALMSLAPIVMLVLIIFAFVMNAKGEDAVEKMHERMTEMMQLVLPSASSAPALFEGEPVPADGVPATETAAVPADGVPATGDNAVPADAALDTLAPQLQEFTGMLLRNTMQHSGSSGTVGIIIFLVLAVFMIAHVEDSFNLIWNTKEARSWMRRFWVYFWVILLGGTLFAAAMSILSVSAVVKTLLANTSSLALTTEGVPVVSAFTEFMTSMAPGFIAFGLMTLIFGSLNKFLPNVEVKWLPALIGGAFVAISFIACGKMASLFVGKISEFNSIYGNLSVIFILMFGLYLGWLFLLIGGEVAYSIQNARYSKNINRKWNELSPRSKQNAYFVCLLTIYAISKRKINAVPAESENGVPATPGPTIDDIREQLNVPANLLRDCLDTLEKLNLILPVISKNDEQSMTRYILAQDGRVAKMTIADIRKIFDNLHNLREELQIACPEILKSASAYFDASFENCGDKTVTLGEMIG